MLTPEQKARLNPEQLTIAEKWEREREERNVLIDKLEESEKTGDRKRFMEILDEMTEIGNPDFCEHERSIWKPCAACEEIERLLYPEFYCKLCEESVENDFGERQVLEDGICPDCKASPAE